MACFWSNMLLGDISRHGNGEVYTTWRDKFGDAPCVKNPIKTQAIIENRHKNLKHAHLKRKDGRLDEVAKELYTAKVGLHRN